MNIGYDERELLPRLDLPVGMPARTVRCDISQRDDTVGEALSRALADCRGNTEQPSGRIVVHFQGNAGDGFGKGLCPGVTFVADEIGRDGCNGMSGGIAVLLASPGDGLCRGLSGGKVYVFAKSETLSGKLASGAFSLRKIQPGTREEQEIRILVEEHAELTGSDHARRILADWNGALGHFTCITAAA